MSTSTPRRNPEFIALVIERACDPVVAALELPFNDVLFPSA